MNNADQMRILLVDDEPAYLNLASIYLERSGFSVKTTSSATEAFKELDCNRFDAIISDYLMPDMDGITFLKEICTTNPELPFIILTGKSREEIAIEALNSGADFYLQKGGHPTAQFVELSHNIVKAVEKRRLNESIRDMNEVLNAILAVSPYGIAFVRNQKIQWLNESFARMFGYTHNEMLKMDIRNLYKNDEEYNRAEKRIVNDLDAVGRSEMNIRLKRKTGVMIDCEIQMAALQMKKPPYGRMITVIDVTKNLAIIREIKWFSSAPYLGPNPMIEVNKDGRITYFNEAAIDLLVKFGDGVRLEVFFPPDIKEILDGITESDTESLYRTVRIGSATILEQIIISRQDELIRIFTTDVTEARIIDKILTGAQDGAPNRLQ
jgi:PAS domain S-box-containing protein